MPVNFLGGEELAKICSKNVRRTQPELHTSLLLKYTIARAAIDNQLGSPVKNDRRCSLGYAWRKRLRDYTPIHNQYKATHTGTLTYSHSYNTQMYTAKLRMPD